MRNSVRRFAAGLLLVATSFVAAAPAAVEPGGRRSKVPILDIDGGLAAMGGTSQGTLVLLYNVYDAGSRDAVTAVRRREIALDGAAISDVTTPLPGGFRWYGAGPFSGYEGWTASIDADGTAALNAGDEVRLLARDGTLSAPMIPSHPAQGIVLRDGFVHLVEAVPASPFRTTIVWEGIRPDGTRVGPSAPMEPSDWLRGLVDDQAPDTADPKWVSAEVASFDTRADGSAVVVIETRFPVPFLTSHVIRSARWLYAIDTEGTVRSIPAPEPSPIGGVNYWDDDNSRAHAGRGATTWIVAERNWRPGLATGWLNVGGWETAIADSFDADARELYASGRTYSGTTTDGRLIVLGQRQYRGRRGGNVVWGSFRAVPGKRPTKRIHVLADGARGRRTWRYEGLDGRAAVAPDGASLFACAAAHDGGGPTDAVPDAADRVLVTVISSRGRALRRLELPAPGYRNRWWAPRAIACGRLGFAVAWEVSQGDVPAAAGVPAKLALIRRR